MSMNDAKYDCQIVTADDEEINLLYFDKAQPQDQLVALRPVRQDSGQNPNETRPESGDYFSQNDFTRGMGQTKAHSPQSEPREYLWSDGFDISGPGLRHSYATETLSATPYTRFADASGFLWAGEVGSTTIYKTNTLTAPFTAVTVANASWTNYMTSDGKNLFHMGGTSGLETFVQKLDETGTWTTWYNGFVPNGRATKGLWAKDRLFWTTTTEIWVQASLGNAAATKMDFWSSGLTCTSIWESGAYVYVALASNNRSEIRHYGLNTAGTAVELKGATKLAPGMEVHGGYGFVGLNLLAGSLQETLNTKRPAFWTASADADGFLIWAKVAEGFNGDVDNSAQLYASAICVMNDRAYVLWPTKSADLLTGERLGLAEFNVATGAFCLTGKIGNTAYSMGGTPNSQLISYQARVVFGAAGPPNSYITSQTKYGPTATFVSSVADWSNAGKKLWQTFDIAYAKPLPSTSSVSVYYTTKDPKQQDWALAGTDSTAGSLGTRFTPTVPITARSLAIKIVSNAATGQLSAPEIASFTVRSDPTIPTTDIEWQLQRVVRLLPWDSKGVNPNTAQKPKELRTALMNLAHQPFTFKEGSDTWKVRMVAGGDFVPHLTNSDTTSGDPSPKDGYLFQLSMQGVRV